MSIKLTLKIHFPAGGRVQMVPCGWDRTFEGEQRLEISLHNNWIKIIGANVAEDDMAMGRDGTVTITPAENQQYHVIVDSKKVQVETFHGSEQLIYTYGPLYDTFYCR